jgi:hypothetical protein
MDKDLVVGKNLKKFIKKYETKIASFCNTANPFFTEEESSFYHFTSVKSANVRFFSDLERRINIKG